MLDKFLILKADNIGAAAALNSGEGGGGVNRI